ncbi:hypothetical protein [Kribbella sp. NPDC051137]|uniref:hypothetical protein n=1 Tax=Kribbella sp. NPDC051137 TaxID=3155045 RepID=UPI0034144F37
MTEVDPGAERPVAHHELWFEPVDARADQKGPEHGFEETAGQADRGLSHSAGVGTTVAADRRGRRQQFVLTDPTGAERRVRDGEAFTERENASGVDYCPQWCGDPPPALVGVCVGPVQDSRWAGARVAVRRDDDVRLLRCHQQREAHRCCRARV